MSLLAIWLVYTFCGVAFFSAVFVWAVRAGQFADQARAARMPVDYPRPPEASPAPDRRAALRVMLTPYALLAVGAAVIVGTAVWVFGR